MAKMDRRWAVRHLIDKYTWGKKAERRGYRYRLQRDVFNIFSSVRSQKGQAAHAMLSIDDVSLNGLHRLSSSCFILSPRYPPSSIHNFGNGSSQCYNHPHA